MTFHSIRVYISELKIFNQFLKNNNYTITNINNKILEEFLKYLRVDRKGMYDNENLTTSRLENYFSALNSFYDFLLYKGLIKTNIILPFRKRFLKRYKKNGTSSERKLISIEDMSNFINSIIPVRDKTIALLLAKTGIRRGELLKIEIQDLNLDEGSITLKDFKKRSNRLIYFDEETKLMLKKWLKRRQRIVKNGVKTLFVSDYGTELGRSGVYNAVTRWAKKLGYYDDKSKRLEDHFSCHNFRHWYTTWLLRNGMSREYVKELRGDRRGEAIDIYHHIDKNDLRKSYLASIPKLDVF
jgi:integrase/recombinase XerD